MDSTPTSNIVGSIYSAAEWNCNTLATCSGRLVDYRRAPSATASATERDCSKCTSRWHLSPPCSISSRTGSSYLLLKGYHPPLRNIACSFLSSLRFASHHWSPKSTCLVKEWYLRWLRLEGLHKTNRSPGNYLWICRAFRQSPSLSRLFLRLLSRNTLGALSMRIVHSIRS